MLLLSFFFFKLLPYVNEKKTTMKLNETKKKPAKNISFNDKWGKMLLFDAKRS